MYGTPGSTSSVPEEYSHVRYTKIDSGKVELGGKSIYTNKKDYTKLSIGLDENNENCNVISNTPLKISTTNTTFASDTTFNGNVNVRNSGKTLTVRNLSGPDKKINVDSDIISTAKITAKNIETTFGPVYNYSSKKQISSGVVGISKNNTYQVKNALPIGTIMMYYGPISSTLRGGPMNVNENLADCMVSTQLEVINNEWAVCNGASIDINVYKEYYEITGKKEVPNFIGRMPLGTGKSYYANTDNTYPTIYRGNYKDPQVLAFLSNKVVNSQITISDAFGYPPSIGVNFIIKIK